MIRVTTTTLALAALVALGCSRSQTQQPPATPTSAASASHATTAAEPELQSVSIAELAGMLERHEAVAIFDNNSRERYERGHVPGARWVGHDQVTAEVLPADHDAKLVFYCANEH